MRDRILLTLALAAGLASGQSITGSLVGTVRDPGGLAIAGAAVKLTFVTTGVERPTATNERGDFVFPSLQPGEYALEVSVQGFKKFEQRQVRLSASEILSVGEIRMEVGAIAETVTVTAQGSFVQTASAERSGVITSNQVDGLMIKGRNVSSLL